MLGRAYGVNLSMVDKESEACKDFQQAADLLDKMLREDVSPDDVCSKDVFSRISEKLKLRRILWQSIRWESYGHNIWT